MKKIIALLFISTTVVIACQKKTTPTASANTNTNSNTNASANNNASGNTAPSAPQTETLTSYASADIDAGKVIYNGKCTKCHAAKQVDTYATDRWERILKSMIPKAKLDENESRQVTAYAMSNAKK